MVFYVVAEATTHKDLVVATQTQECLFYSPRCD